MPGLTITLIGFPEAQAKLTALSDALAGSFLMRAVTSAALLVQTDAAARAPVKTGNLRRSLHTQEIASSRNLAIVQVGTDVAYARGVEYGTRPHVITARPGHWLYWRGAAHPVKRVNHPGTRAQPFLIPALTQNVGRIRAEIVAALSALLKRS